MKFGVFQVAVKDPWDFETLRAAQLGVAITRCEYLAHLRAYEVVGEHPEFDEVRVDELAPCYLVEITQYADGNRLERTRFVRLK